MFQARWFLFGLMLALGLQSGTGIAAAMDTDQAVAYLADRLIAKRHGMIAQVKGKDVYIALGKDDGILDGSQFDLVRLGDPIEIRGQVLGQEERLIGKVIARRVLEKLTIAESLAALDSPRVGDRAYLTRGPVTRILVAPFTLRGGVTGLSQQIQEGMTTALLKAGVAVVERSQLDQVLAEQKLSYSGLVQLESAKKLGELLGADAIILGSLRDLGDEVGVTARLVALETGTGYTAAQAMIAKSPTVNKQLGESVRGHQVPPVRRHPTPGGLGEKDEQAYPMAENETFRFEIMSSHRLPEAIAVRVRVTNKTKGKLWMFPAAHQDWYLMDALGEMALSTGNSGLTGKWVPPNFSRVGTLHFEDNPKIAERLSLAGALCLNPPKKVGFAIRPDNDCKYLPIATEGLVLLPAPQ